MPFLFALHWIFNLFTRKCHCCDLETIGFYFSSIRTAFSGGKRFAFVKLNSTVHCDVSYKTEASWLMSSECDWDFGTARCIALRIHDVIAGTIHCSRYFLLLCLFLLEIVFEFWKAKFRFLIIIKILIFFFLNWALVFRGTLFWFACSSKGMTFRMTWLGWREAQRWMWLAEVKVKIIQENVIGNQTKRISLLAIQFINCLLNWIIKWLDKSKKSNNWKNVSKMFSGDSL